MPRLRQLAHIVVALLAAAGCQAKAQAPNPVIDFGTVRVGSSVTITVTGPPESGFMIFPFTYTPDFEYGGLTTCGDNNCTLQLIFHPQYAGLHYAVVKNYSGNRNEVVTTSILKGTGDGPQVVFNSANVALIVPSIFSTLPALSSPNSVAFDRSDTIYMTGLGTGVLSIPADFSSTGEPGFLGPTVDGIPVGHISSLAVNGAGDLFMVDTSNARVVEVPSPYPLDYFPPVALYDTVSQSPDLRAIAVDGAENLFVSDASNSTVLEFLAAGNAGSPNIITPTVHGNPLTDVFAMATDPAGDLYLANQSASVPVVMLTAAAVAAGGTQEGTVINPVVDGSPLGIVGGLTVDSTGNLYLSAQSGQIVEVPASNGPVITFTPTLNDKSIGSGGLAVDEAGNLAIADTGNNQVAELTRSQSPSLSFYPSPVGVLSADSPRTQQVENVGTQPLIFQSFTFPQDFPEAAGGANLCATATPLAAGAICNVYIDSLPQVSGPLTEKIIFGENSLNNNGGQKILHASNNRVAKVTLSANALAYGDQAIGTKSGSQDVTLSNGAGVPLAIADIVVTGTDASSFVFGSNCPTSLATGGKCTIHGHFAPTASGPLSALLTVMDNGAGSPQQVGLSGTGLAAPVASLTASSLSYGVQQVGTEDASQLVSLTNTGGSGLSISGIKVTGAGAASFVFGNDCPPQLAVGASCTIHGHFAPVAAGAQTASVTISDSAATSPQVITLSGTGISQPTTASLSATSIQFGNEAIGTSTASQFVTLTNTGSSTLNIALFQVSGPGASSFFFGNTCGTLLAAGASCQIHGHFTPASAGLQTAVVMLTYLGGVPAQAIMLNGTGQ